MAVSVVGLGKLGLCTAACLSCEGIPVIGYDNDETKISNLSKRKCYIDEPGLEDKLNDAFINHSFAVTNSIETIVEHTNQTFIIVPTPSNEYGYFSNASIIDVLKKMVIPLRRKKEYHIINIVSTVMPGSCNKFITYIEKHANKIAGKDFDVVYNPEFVAIGNVIQGFLHPDMVLIGSNSENAGKAVADNYKTISNNIQIMSLINAELTKLSLNCFLTMKISFINEIATICEVTPGANIDYITNAMGCDSRIGRKLMTAGLGFGGPCLPRDIIALSAYAKKKGYNPHLLYAINKTNNKIIGKILSKILCHAPQDAIIDIYGSSYKSGTKLTEGSQSIILKNQLIEMGYQNTRMFDNPHNYDKDDRPLVIIMMSDNIKMKFEDIITKETIFIDPWRKYMHLKKHCIYYGTGVSVD